MEPRTAAVRAESEPAPPGTDERFAGYGLLGIPFSSGHLLALRRFPVSTVGPGYDAVWIRDPAGAWTMVTTVAPEQSCPRYFGAAVGQHLVGAVRSGWTDAETLHVETDTPDLDWTVRLRSTPITTAMSALCSALPDALWRKAWFSRAMGATATALLHTGTLRLSGATPNRQHFVARPRRIWLIADSKAVLDGADLGPPAPLPVQASLADFWLPQRGLFMVGWSGFAAPSGALAP